MAFNHTLDVIDDMQVHSDAPSVRLCPPLGWYADMHGSKILSDVGVENKTSARHFKPVLAAEMEQKIAEKMAITVSVDVAEQLVASAELS